MPSDLVCRLIAASEGGEFVRDIFYQAAERIDFLEKSSPSVDKIMRDISEMEPADPQSPLTGGQAAADRIRDGMRAMYPQWREGE